MALAAEKLMARWRVSAFARRRDAAEFGCISIPLLEKMDASGGPVCIGSWGVFGQ